METVSVIIPTWNRAHLIGKAIESVLAQTYPVLEVLVCDDGSTDNTAEFIGSYGDKRVKYIDCGRNGHPSVPRNIGITRSQGDWLAFLDSDDFWEPEKVEKQITRLKAGNGLACCTNAYRNIPGIGLQGKLIAYSKEDIAFTDLLEYNPVVCSSILLHRSLLEKVKGFPEEPSCKGVEDYALWLRICSLRTIAYIDEPLVTYMDDAKNSVRGEVTNNFYEQRIQLFKNFLSWSPKGSTYDTIVKNLLAKTKIMFIYSLLKLSIKNLIKK